MKIKEKDLENYIDEAMIEGMLEVIDHRGNSIKIIDGVFYVNYIAQPKTEKIIKSIFFEAFKLSRYITLNDLQLIRKGLFWLDSNKEEEKNLLP